MAKYLALAVVLCLALSATADEKKVEKKQEASPEPARKVGDRWEYAELHYTAPRSAFAGFKGKKDDVQPAPAPVKLKGKVLWITGEGETEGESWEDLSAKLKAPAAAKDAKAAAHKVKFMNHLGAQGWELVSSDGSVWTFKRKATK